MIPAESGRRRFFPTLGIAARQPRARRLSGPPSDGHRVLSALRFPIGISAGRHFRVACTLACRARLWWLAPFSFLAAATAFADEKPITYEDHVSAILKKHCATCHGDGKQEGSLSLVNYAGVMKGAGSGEIVIAGRSGGSRLVEVITAPDDGERMPPEGDRVPADQVAVIKKWIDTGLRENAGSSVAAMRTLGF